MRARVDPVRLFLFRGLVIARKNDDRLRLNYPIARSTSWAALLLVQRRDADPPYGPPHPVPKTTSSDSRGGPVKALPEEWARL